MKTFLIAAFVVLAFASEALAGSPDTCPASVYNMSNLSPWIIEEIKDELEKRKDKPFEELVSRMNDLVEKIEKDKDATDKDLLILHEFLNDPYFSGKGEIDVTIKAWGCYIRIHIKW
ncbi:unnamed protein product [Chironomus riparius]|uniref:Uncharacterized protein n=1 Tax=Chironomus riparius TaxID=315576 RepID=A0A9N9S6E8_9DIPT|nr:unnamed protein product [Chironomus riparius]